MADRLQFSPEAVPQLRARMAAALVYVYDERAIRLGGAIRPGEVRAQCFDWPDGLRVVLARVEDAGGDRFVQASAWVEKGSELFKVLGRRIAAAGRHDEEAIRAVLATWGRGAVLARLVEVGAPPLEFTGVTSGGLVAFVGPDVEGDKSC